MQNILENHFDHTWGVGGNSIQKVYSLLNCDMNIYHISVHTTVFEDFHDWRFFQTLSNISPIRLTCPKQEYENFLRCVYNHSGADVLLFEEQAPCNQQYFLNIFFDESYCEITGEKIGEVLKRRHKAKSVYELMEKSSKTDKENSKSPKKKRTIQDYLIDLPRPARKIYFLKFLRK